MPFLLEITRNDALRTELGLDKLKNQSNAEKTLWKELWPFMEDALKIIQATKGSSIIFENAR